jgi:hypothetical protein
MLGWVTSFVAGGYGWPGYLPGLNALNENIFHGACVYICQATRVDSAGGSWGLLA